eukprot:TRINITY_DN117_c1_g3_i1.p1 TRINITY_DN117_c1_g3~~TRINITY_DN117_c1_g3_i1.p1  ORF type:complete len:332 (+),score=159.71 TRINITY_DN117_c1_g3_i1:57-1052(+)
MQRKDDPQNRFISSAFNKSNDKNNIDSTLRQMLGEQGDLPLTATRTISNSSICAGCSREIASSSEFRVVDSQKWHATCFNREFPCGRCSQPVFGNGIEGCGKYWHQNCWNCTFCFKKISGGFYAEHNGYPYCNNQCLNEQKQEQQQQQQQQSNRNNLNSNASKQQPQQQQQQSFNNQKGKETCPQCRQVIPGQAININGSFYHLSCVTCSSCRQSADCGASFTQVNNTILCIPCAARSNGTMCGCCNQPIQGKMVGTPDGVKYHPECFSCSRCRQPISAAFAQIDSKIVCGNCAQTSPRTTSSSTTTTTAVGQRKAGFTIDPRTGQKKVLK